MHSVLIGIEPDALSVRRACPTLCSRTHLCYWYTAHLDVSHFSLVQFGVQPRFEQSLT